MSIQIDGKRYALKEAYTIDQDVVETRWATDWRDGNTYEVNVATDVVAVEKCFVLVEEEES